MNEKPILFSGPMVRAILDRSKTQTRRVIKPQPIPFGESSYGGTRQGWKWKPESLNRGWNDDDKDPYRITPLAKSALACECPHGNPGERLYVKEHAWMFCEKVPNGTTPKGRPKFKYVPLRSAQVWYCADHPETPGLDVIHPVTENQWGWRKKLGRFLPKWASRITLEIVQVRVERLQDISRGDAAAEGSPFSNMAAGPNPRDWYAKLWESINGSGSWGANPWVWVIEFKRL